MNNLSAVFGTPVQDLPVGRTEESSRAAGEAARAAADRGYPALVAVTSADGSGHVLVALAAEGDQLVLFDPEGEKVRFPGFSTSDMEAVAKKYPGLAFDRVATVIVPAP
jgi:hypothetical protein